MYKRVIIIHGWDGYPEEGWFPWLKVELEKKGLEVIVPQMPNPAEPRIEKWVSKLIELVGEINDETYFVGHSMGCQTIVRYLAGLKGNVQCGGAVFVAGFLDKLSNLEEDEIVKDVANEWLHTPVDLDEVKKHLPKSIAFFSDNDPYVPIENKNTFSDILNSEVVIEKNKGHFSGSTGTLKLPVVLDALLRIVED